ncbi:hypothetical protein LTR10_016140 [Elasticomyces elasticus]|uniref:Helicase ATP-binding domain-containing protein n=1 Tax=Exophiala sideris TaxID=1016849 RepID=A0ABR0JEJ1_9EURO|nr:hypothetical protein LTR10_016140 [Elasticomyces elasticus]KAK5027586.1 hypothetical protein LTR13_009519 [Exophiala sideris]KAK5032852.1 hypothetical protein LTS07_004262 [Exophiala sideris]KAK5062376.1 hypothetical protein LTR69_004734 [Exophiala sideris]KAK5177534.1 hypothetical protein LTR44_009944 [Eurotiomycetes sp. CCFEE 6388]
MASGRHTGRPTGKRGQRPHGGASDRGHDSSSIMQNGEMNANLSERFKGGRLPNTHQALTNAFEHGLDLSLNLDIRDYVQKQDSIKQSSEKDAWLSQPEFPTVDELAISEAAITPNKIEGPYRSKVKYLKIHYGLQREDALGSLRDALNDFRQNPAANDTTKYSVYDQVHIVGFTFARRGLAARIQFSTKRAGKRISWQTSKRLVSGSIVALFRAKDKLTDLNGLVVAVVAARPLAGVLAEPPEIDIYFSSPEAIQIDPQEEWLMIEAKQGYFEAYRHTLRALQKLSQETFPLSEHICQLNPSIEAPAYVQDNPVLDLSAAAKLDQKKDYEKVDITKEWPPAPKDSLDDTQWEALQEIITKKLAIIQGPPGTGKTYVSKIAVEILQAKRKAGDPPIIIAAQTNHALDQLLGHISHFEPNYIRLGGRSTNPEVKKRALFEIRQEERIKQIPGGLFGRSNNLLTKQSKAMSSILEPLTSPGNDPYSTDQVSGPAMLLKLGVLNAQQAKSLEDGATQWVSTTTSLGGPIQLWLDRALLPFEVKYAHDGYGFDEVEDEDLEFEQLRENEDSAGVNDEEDIELLKGPWIRVHEKFTVRPASSSDIAKATKLLSAITDLWKVPDYLRGPMYSVIQSRAKAALAQQFRGAAVTYNKLIKENLVGKWEQDAVYLQRAAIIGMTTTGLSKYRPLVSALKPKIILIEEAAEVLEAPVTVACIESLEHLVLVGDHQQLQGHCSVQELEGDPFNLNVSLFERLVRNNMPYKTLLRQRRMDPEFRRLIADLYPNLSDHPSVLDRAVEPWGMGKIKSFFFDHSWSEYKDESLSTYNPEEAKMIAAFYRHLNKNGVGPEQLTVLTFYNGQRKKILKELRSYSDITAGYLQVKTVDSYQGEENNVVILSLTRSNEDGRIGFLANINRVCVALSRAKFGFYIFGNARALMAGSELWYNVVQRMRASPKRLDNVLPIQCKDHGLTCLMQYPEDWAKMEGGCTNSCDTALDCGHPCPLLCHPYSHDKVQCPEDCMKKLPCSHGCDRKCSQPCYCSCDEFARIQKLETEKAWSMPDASVVGQSVQDIRVSQGFNGQSVPSIGSTPYLQQQIQPDSRNTGPSYWDAVLDSAPPASADAGPIDTKQQGSVKPSSTGYKVGGAWNPTPKETIETHHLTAEKQNERRKGWNTYAKGGVVVDDKRRGIVEKAQVMPTVNSKAIHSSLVDSTLSRGVPPPASVTGQVWSPVKETIRALGDGRSIFKQEYRVEASHGRRSGQSKQKPPAPGLGGGRAVVTMPGPEADQNAGNDIMNELAGLDAYYRKD